MAKHVLSVEERLRAARSALASPRFPAHMRKGLERHAQILRRKLRREQETRKKRGRPRKKKIGLLDWLGL